VCDTPVCRVEGHPISIAVSTPQSDDRSVAHAVSRELSRGVECRDGWTAVGIARRVDCRGVCESVDCRGVSWELSESVVAASVSVLVSSSGLCVLGYTGNSIGGNAKRRGFVWVIRTGLHCGIWICGWYHGVGGSVDCPGVVCVIEAGCWTVDGGP